MSEMTEQKKALILAYLALKQREEPIAIVGMGCRFPGEVDNPDDYWSLLSKGTDAVDIIPNDRWEADAFYDPDPDAPGKMYTRHGGFLRDVATFDARFFGISPREAAGLDPQQRLLLEVTWEALENAGIIPRDLRESNTGVFVGLINSDYRARQIQFADPKIYDAYTASGNYFSAAAGRISYVLGLRGPCIAIDTACSSSLVAVHQAVTSLRQGEADLALAGGVNVFLSPDTYIERSQAHMLSPTGRCHTFDASADGFVPGEGCGVLVLKRLSRAVADGDRVYGIVRGSSVNHGGPSQGLTVPSGPAQAALIRTALANARLNAHDIGYVEAHGTGTSLGDPIEVNALAAALCKDRPKENPLYLGSVKTNIGHLESAAGVAGLIKTALVLQHREIPAHLHLENKNPNMDWDRYPLEIPTRATSWHKEEGKRFAGVSSFGFAGTNAHVILEEPPEAPESAEDDDRPLLFPLSAREEESLRGAARRLAGWLGDEQRSGRYALADVAETLVWKRTRHDVNMAAVAASRAELAQALTEYADGIESNSVVEGRKSEAGKIAFIYSGQGPQWFAMGREMMEYPVFREKLNEIDGLFKKESGWSIIEELQKDEENTRVGETEVAQPALFALQMAMTELWRSVGIRPAAVVGHSVGEVASACVSGAISPETAVKVIFHRSREMQKATELGGRMAEVRLPADEATKFIQDYSDRLSIAAENAPGSVVVAGEEAALDEILAKATEKGIYTKKMRVNYAFHSPMMEDAKRELIKLLDGLNPQAAKVEVFSTLAGKEVNGSAFTPEYWGRNIREPVLFQKALESMVAEGCNIFIEVAPHPVLSPYVVDLLRSTDGFGEAVPSLRRKSERSAWLAAVGKMYALGYSVQWDDIQPRTGRPVVPIPGYSFLRKKHWFDESKVRRKGAARGTPTGHALLGSRLNVPLPTFESELNAGSFKFLEEHKIMGRTFLPRTALVELVRAAGERVLGGDKGIVLENVVFDGDLGLPADAPAVVQTVIHGSGDDLNFGVYAQGPDDKEDAWTRYAGGRLSVNGKATAGETLDAARKNCARKGDQASAFSFLAEDAMASMKWIKEVHLGDNAMLCKVDVPAEMRETEGYRLHAELLQICRNMLWATMKVEPNPMEIWMFSAADRIAFHGGPGSSLLCYVSLKPPANGSAPEGAARIYTQGGEVLLDLSGCRLVAAQIEELAGSLPAPAAEEMEDSETVGESPVMRKLREASPGTERVEILEDFIRESIVRVMRLDSGDGINPQEGFFSMGMDSLMAVQLRNGLDKAFGRKMPATVVFEHPTIQTLAVFLETSLPLGNAPSEDAPTAAAVPEQPAVETVTAEQLEEYSDEELVAMLAAELS